MSDADRIRELGDAWLGAAQEDLQAATQLLQVPDYEVYRIPSFLAQQAAEKALKAVLTHLQIDWPRTHDLGTLHGLVPSGWEHVANCAGLDELTRYAVDTRYPDDLAERVTLAEANAAVVRSQTLIEAVLTDVVRHANSHQGGE